MKRLLLFLLIFCLSACSSLPAGEPPAMTIQSPAATIPLANDVSSQDTAQEQSTAVRSQETANRPTADLSPSPAPPPISAPTGLPALGPTAGPTAEPTLTSTPRPSTFAAFGDYGWTGQGTIDVAALVADLDPDVIITVGDNNYPDGAAWSIQENITDHYGRFIADGRFFPALGNHDVTTDFGQPYFDYFQLPGNERYYDFVLGDAHFFAINSDWREPDGIRATSRQAAWLQEALAASESAWQIVYFHAPPYVSMAEWMVPVMRWPFADWGADLVISGHAHLYERLQIDGIPYLVSGLGGYYIYPFDEEPHPASQVRFNAAFGALFGTITAESIHLQFVTTGGQVVDDFVIGD